MAVIEKYMEHFNLEFREGRSEKAANLHELNRARRQEECDNGRKIFSFEVGRVDSWASRRKGGAVPEPPGTEKGLVHPV